VAQEQPDLGEYLRKFFTVNFRVEKNPTADQPVIAKIGLALCLYHEHSRLPTTGRAAVSRI
jgi:hypothetical protein